MQGRTPDMKLHILSDLHSEFENYKYTETDSDVVILAGDTNLRERGVTWALDTIKGKPIVYIMGNHEYYGAAYPKLVNSLKEKYRGTDIQLLENDVFTYQNVNFLGCTLWTDFELFGDPRIYGYECQQVMSDYKKIRVSPRFSKLRSIDVAVIHRRSRNWLELELKSRMGQTNVVVTHHAPSPKSLEEERRLDTTSAAYASQLERVVEDYSPELWVHGHIHSSSDYTIGDCRVICNPRGYPDERNREFQSELVIEV